MLDICLSLSEKIAIWCSIVVRVMEQNPMTLAGVRMRRCLLAQEIGRRVELVLGMA